MHLPVDANLRGGSSSDHNRKQRGQNGGVDDLGEVSTALAALGVGYWRLWRGLKYLVDGGGDVVGWTNVGLGLLFAWVALVGLRFGWAWL
jgi:hypothetical protein